jgi:hypothetical protein
MFFKTLHQPRALAMLAMDVVALRSGMAWHGREGGVVSGRLRINHMTQHPASSNQHAPTTHETHEHDRLKLPLGVLVGACNGRPSQQQIDP